MHGRGLHIIGMKHRVAMIFAGLLFASVILGARPIIRFADLTCGPGTVVRYTGPAYWAVECAPSAGSSESAAVPTSRYVGLFLTNVDLRVFDADFIAGSFLGPGLGVRLGL